MGVNPSKSIAAKMMARQSAHGWSPKDADKGLLIIACPRPELSMSDGRVLTFTGEYIIRAVREFFNSPDAQVKKNWGFVVDRSGAVDLLNHSDGEPDPPSCLDRYEMVNEPDLDDWKVIVERHD
ncbi:hypothetical protein LTR10_004561 [Elasticomyces elasticus]|nr:hypothetical protein LTR10_004561 [Elasticomyces elasticus]KAK4976881.1 hypothetical protein LTR42_002926 [Elasticomyces elasticus]